MITALDFQDASAPLLFDLSPLAALRQAPPPADLATRWPQYTLVLVEEEGYHVGPLLADNQVPRTLYFGRPGQTALELVPKRAKGQVLRFTDEFVRLTGTDRELLLFQLFHQAAAEPVLVPDEQAMEMAFLVGSLQRQAASAAILRDDLLRSYLKTLLLHCTRLSQQQRGATGSMVQAGLFGRFQQLLELHYAQWKSVAEYADQLHVTANHLSVSIRKETGQPASEHIRRRIMLEAKRLVSLRDASLKEVAYQLGFEDVAHFSKLFKRCTGITFSHFKKQIQAQYNCPLPKLMIA
ncbi:helix-turn-helix domain-containing protein [Hymenobacter volaticus]|uniref:Helix-turn-helix domain-containing protein n=1 Tax=Hymenobacter volaticus TaxID=2932254 RepID=A0ABY4GBL9_9BACT|nr:helix-turn-helix domain-containing protein [Hymenobacter volaticus]UOQ68325.1 helix-turn-helix domain-containing protein [Hymenobacter volaticus]